jgi:cytochrome P450
VHRTAPAWQEPEEFRPERFLATGTSARADYLPFGLGPRLCIGRDMALLELLVLLSELLHGHAVTLPEGTEPPGRDAFTTVRPHGGLRLRFVSEN